MKASLAPPAAKGREAQEDQQARGDLTVDLVLPAPGVLAASEAVLVVKDRGALMVLPVMTASEALLAIKDRGALAIPDRKARSDPRA